MVTQGRRNRCLSIHHDFLSKRSIATMRLSRTVSEINGDFSRKVQIFLLPFTLRPAEGFPWNWISALGVEDYDYGTTLRRPRKKFNDIFRRLDTMHEHDRQRRTAGRTDTERQQRPRLRITSRGKRRVSWG